MLQPRTRASGAYAELGQRQRPRTVGEAVDTRARCERRLERVDDKAHARLRVPSLRRPRLGRPNRPDPVGYVARVPSSPATGDDMQLDIHVPRFTWPGGPEAIGPTFTSLAQTAEVIGVRTLSVMDHWFQMDMLWPAEEPLPEVCTALALAPAKTERLRFRLLVGGVTYRHPGLLAKTVTTLD